MLGISFCVAFCTQYVVPGLYAHPNLGAPHTRTRTLIDTAHPHPAPRLTHSHSLTTHPAPALRTPHGGNPTRLVPKRTLKCGALAPRTPAQVRHTHLRVCVRVRVRGAWLRARVRVRVCGQSPTHIPHFL